MSLDSVRDSALEAIAVLVQKSLNAKMKPALGVNVIETLYDFPMTPPMIASAAYPCMCVYRDRDRDREDSFFDFLDTQTFGIDYLPGATSFDELGPRWKLLRAVWVHTIGVLRIGRDPKVADERAVLFGGSSRLDRYVLEASETNYSYWGQDRTAYPYFRGKVTFEGNYPTPDSFYDGASKTDRLPPFARMVVNWDLAPKDGVLEAQDDIALPQD